MNRLLIFFCAFCTAAACTFDPGPNPGSNLGSPDVASDTNSDIAADTRQPDGSTPDVRRDTRPANDTSTNDVSGSDTNVDTSVDTQPDAPIQNVCDGVQKDLQNDSDHCGRCNNACDDNFGGCVAGSCVCPFTTEPCGALNSCTDTEFDPNNCGGCGTQCSPGEYCINSVCTCRPGYTLCNGECVDTENDPRYCGSCTNSCNGDACKEGACRDNDRCGALGGWRCDVPNAGVACVQGQSSHLHCSPGFGDECGKICAADEFCYDPGFGRPRDCYTFRPAIRCQSCPCNECSEDETCSVGDDIPGEIFCLEN